MGNTTSVMLALLLLSSVSGLGSGEQTTEHVVIKNLKSGLMCVGDDDKMHVCVETTEIPVTGKGTCVLDRREVPCTWYGFSFNYDTLTEPATLNCLWSADEAGDLGNPEKMKVSGVKESQYQLDLSVSETHFANPQYSVSVYV